jgi:hypothetical protein
MHGDQKRTVTSPSEQWRGVPAPQQHNLRDRRRSKNAIRLSPYGSLNDTQLKQCERRQWRHCIHKDNVLRHMSREWAACQRKSEQLQRGDGEGGAQNRHAKKRP